MKVEQLEQIVGPINRRFLAEGFPSESTVAAFAEEKYLSKDEKKPRPPQLTEDLSYLNPSSYKRCQETGRLSWKRLSRAKKLKRIKTLKTADKSGGIPKRKMVIRYSHPKKDANK